MNTTQEPSISNNNWKLVLDLDGGRIKEVYSKNKLIIGTFQRIDGKSSNTHLCTPNFGAEGAELNLPFHGPTRNQMWTLQQQTASSVTIECKTTATEKYPSPLLIEQKFTLNDNFRHEIVITNQGQIEVPVNLAIHYYWATPAGWQGTTVNGYEVTAEIENNGNIPLSDQNDIIFPDNSKIRLSTKNFHKAVLWTAFLKKENTTAYDNNFCCIEPVNDLGSFFGSPGSMLKPQTTRTYQADIDFDT